MMDVIFKFAKRFIESESENGDSVLSELMSLNDDYKLLDDEDASKRFDEFKAEPIIKWAGELLNEKPDEVLVFDNELADELEGMTISDDERQEIEDSYFYGYVDILRVAENLERGELHDKLMTIIENARMN